MAENSKIEWTTHTFSPWIGCQHVSAGCDNCFAETLMDTRYGKVEWGPHGERKRTSAEYWKQPHRWAKKAKAAGIRPRVFCASLCDVFDNQVPERWRYDLFAMINFTPELDWLLLTKRPENIGKMLAKNIELNFWPWPNVWLGITAEDQENYDRRWPILAKLPAAVRFVSYEPAIGPLNIKAISAAYNHVHVPSNAVVPVLRFPDWLICGGETGKSPRMMESAWARDVRDQCASTYTAFFFKQMTGKKPIPEDLMVRQFPTPKGKTTP